MSQKSGWGAIVPQIEPAQRTQIVEEVAETFKGRPLEELRQDTEKLVPLATQGVLASAGRLGIQITETEIEDIAREVVARVGGLGFLAPLLRLDSDDEFARPIHGLADMLFGGTGPADTRNNSGGKKFSLAGLTVKV